MAVCGFLLETLVTSGGYGNVIKFCRTSLSFKVRTLGHLEKWTKKQFPFRGLESQNLRKNPQSPREGTETRFVEGLQDFRDCQLETPITSRGYGN